MPKRQQKSIRGSRSLKRGIRGSSRCLNRDRITASRDSSHRISISRRSSSHSRSHNGGINYSSCRIYNNSRRSSTIAAAATVIEEGSSKGEAAVAAATR